MSGALRVGSLLLAEKLLRWCLHPKLRGRLLRLLGARVGRGVRINEVFFANPLQGFGLFAIGDDGYIGQGCLIDLTGPVEIGARTAVSPGCSFLTHADPGSMCGNRLATLFPRKVRGIRIGSDSWIGAGAIVLCGVTIGSGSVVGAGSVVTRDVPDHVLVAGNPAQIIRTLAPQETPP